MDPQATLVEMLSLLADRHEGDRVAELLEALHDWITQGGYLPRVERRGEGFIVPGLGGAP